MSTDMRPVDPRFPFPIKKLPPPTLASVVKPAHDTYTHFEHGMALPFDAASASFSRLNAWWLADAALLAYWEKDDVKTRCEGAGFTTVEPLVGDDTQCFVASNEIFAIVSFRGTEPDKLGDILADARFGLEPWKVAGERVHRGFQIALEAVWPALLASLKQLKDHAIWFTGHSLGAALATLAGDRYRLECGRQPRGIYTYGSPLLGDRAFVDGFNNRHRDRSFRFVNDRDSVTTVPPPLFDYRHVNDERLVGFDDPDVLNFAEPLIDHAPRRYAVLAWNSLVAAMSPASVSPLHPPQP